MKIFFILTCCLLFISGYTTKKDPPTGYDIATAVFASTKKINSLTYHMEKTERIDEEFVKQNSFIKLNRNPFKVYTRQKHPDKGLEVLYVHGENGNKALINPAGFPWVNVKLDPLGSTMRSDQHHTILEAGYDYVISILEHLFKKYGEENVRLMVKNKGVTSVDGQPAWIIEFNNPHFKYEEYTVGPGETIHSIAEKNKVSGYMILKINKEVREYGDVRPGQVIKIPSDYSPRLVLIIDKHRMIPLVMTIYDDKGLYEQYEYSDITIDPELSPAEFTVAYEEYDF